jgi:putative oxidoreductase
MDSSCGAQHGRGCADVGLFLIRAIVGVVGMYHGSGKLFGAFGGHGIGEFAKNLQGMHVPLPYVSAVLSGLAEFGGGLALLVGFAVPIAGLIFAFNMGVAVGLVHWPVFSGAHGMEYPLTLGVVALGLAFTGAGRLSISGVCCRGATVKSDVPAAPSSS